MRIHSKFGVGVAGAVLALGASAVPAQASAPSQAPESVAACSYRASKPYLERGIEAWARVEISGCSGGGSAMLLRERWYGWQVVGEIVQLSSTDVDSVGGWCDGEGTYTYKAVVDDSHGTQKASSPTARFTC